MRHEHGLDADAGQRALDLVAVDALRLESLQDVENPNGCVARWRCANTRDGGGSGAPSPPC
jgi:hypothetical protein